MVGSPNLTCENHSYLVTEPGQAHFAIGPHTCRSCDHWANKRAERDKHLNLKPARCLKALELSMNRDGIPPIPHSATSCRYFQANPNPPEP